MKILISAIGAGLLVWLGVTLFRADDVRSNETAVPTGAARPAYADEKARLQASSLPAQPADEPEALETASPPLPTPELLAPISSLPAVTTPLPPTTKPGALTPEQRAQLDATEDAADRAKYPDRYQQKESGRRPGNGRRGRNRPNEQQGQQGQAEGGGQNEQQGQQTEAEGGGL